MQVPSCELDLGSNTYFLFRNGPTEQGSVNKYTVFYGSISTLSVNPVPEPSTHVVLASGLALMGWLAWRNKAAPSTTEIFVEAFADLGKPLAIGIVKSNRARPVDCGVCN